MRNGSQLLDRITVNDRILLGKPTIRGLRISVEHILRALAARVTEVDILGEHPELEAEDLKAALAYAAEQIASERVCAISDRRP